jgi:hypothetical protein
MFKSKMAGMLCLVAVFCLASVAMGEENQESWVRLWTRAGFGEEVQKDVCIDTQGNVIVLGKTYITGFNTAWVLVKYSPTGDKLWDQVVDHNTENFDLPVAVGVDADGNVYTVGDSRSGSPGLPDEHYSIVLTKHNSAGALQWTRIWDGAPAAGDRDDKAVAMVVDSTGNSYIAGNSDAGYAAIRYNASGDLVYATLYQTYPDGMIATAIAVDEFGNAHITGSAQGVDDYFDFLTAKFNASGVRQWDVRHTITGQHSYEPVAVVYKNGRIYVTGVGLNAQDHRSIHTVAYNDAGVEQWSVVYSSDSTSHDIPVGLAVDTAGNCFVGGIKKTDSLSSDFLVLKYNAAGVFRWERAYDGSLHQDDIATDFGMDTAGNIYITGTVYTDRTTQSRDFGTVKWSPDGNKLYDYIYSSRLEGTGDAIPAEDQAGPMAVAPDGVVVVTGRALVGATYWDLQTLRYPGGGVPPPTGLVRFDSTQTVKITAPSLNYECQAWNYALSQQVAFTSGTGLGTMDYPMPSGEWVGLFLYDATAGQWNQGKYLYMDTWN